MKDLLAAAAREGLHVTPDSSELDRSGLDFLVVHARDAEGIRWIVRTPRRADVVAAMRIEARMLALARGPLSAEAAVAVPHWRIFADDVVAYPRLEGTPAVTIDAERGPTWNIIDPATLQGARADAFLASFATALAALQRIPVDASVPAASIDEVRADTARSITATRAALQPSDAVVARWQRWLDDDAMWPGFTALVHGDLHPGHMLLDDTGTVTGILDWTEAKATDPAIDLAMFFGCFGAPALDALLVHFERAGGRTWPRVREHAGERWAAFPLVVAEFALKTNDEGFLAHAKAQLAALTP